MNDFARRSAPRDSGTVEKNPQWLDVGCLWIAMNPEMEVSVELDPQTRVPTGIALMLGHSTVSVQAFAKERYTDAWPPERDKIREQLRPHGVETEVVLGSFGTEVRTVMPSINYDGKPIVQSVRFLGIDGPRWFLRAVVSGDGAVGGYAHDAVDDAISGLVVNRGDRPMAPGTALVITLPDGEIPEEAESDTVHNSQIPPRPPL